MGLFTLASLRSDALLFWRLVLISAAPAVTVETVKPLVDGSRADFSGTIRSFVDACVPESQSDHI